MKSTDKLISADAFFKRICDDTSIRGSAFAAIRRHLDAEPAVDAMEVVRCKDCKHFGGHGACNCHAADENGTPIFVREDDFCSYGERREGE